MSDHDRTTTEPDRAEPETPTPFERFESLAKRLLHVSKDDVREAGARERQRKV